MKAKEREWSDRETLIGIQELGLFQLDCYSV